MSVPRIRAWRSTYLQKNWKRYTHELDFVNVPRSTDSSRLTWLVLLKTHQCLNYFPNLQVVPSPIVAYLRDCLELPSGTPLSTAENTVYRHHQAIRAFLGVKSFSDGGEAIIKEAMFQAAQRRNDPADLVNAAIENLIHLRREFARIYDTQRIGAKDTHRSQSDMVYQPR